MEIIKRDIVIGIKYNMYFTPLSLCTKISIMNQTFLDTVSKWMKKTVR